MKKSINLFLCLSLFFNVQAQVSKIINSTSAGTLTTLLTATEKTTVTDLTVTGNIDARDFVTLRDEMTKLSVLDISAVCIISYTGGYGTNLTKSSPYPANELPENSFYNSSTLKSTTNLKSINLPTTVTSVGICAFFNCTVLTNIIFPASLTTIRFNAFQGCNGLTVINIPGTLTSIDMRAFWRCSGLTGFTVDAANPSFSDINGILCNKDKTTLIQYPGNKLGAFVIPNSVITVQGWAFSFCNGLTTVSIPTTVTSIGTYAFGSCDKLNNISIPNSVTKIESYAFTNCTGLTNISIPNTVTSIGDYAFSGCIGLKNIIIPNSTTTLGSAVFYQCTGLTTISIPKSVISIGDYTFSCCYSLTSIYAYPIMPIDLMFVPNVFFNTSKTACKLYVPNNSRVYYTASSQWKDFTNIIEMTTAVPTLADSKVSIYPNPMKEYFRITGLEGTYTVSISDLSGRILFTKKVVEDEIIFVGTLPKGMYLVKINNGKSVIERKVMKE